MASSVEEAYYDWLKGQSTVTALADVYWQEAPTGSDYPLLVMWVVDDPNLKQYVNVAEQGAARVQHDIYAMNMALGLRIRSVVRRLVDAMQTTEGGYTMYCESVTEQTVPRAEQTEPYHMVVDAVIRWRNG